MTRNPFLGVQPEDLKAIARQAASDHLSNGTDLTDSVVKAASLFDRPLTTEHVRRVCEMAYHDAFEKRFHEKRGSMDRYVSFDPPDAVAASSRLRAEKVASARTTKEASAMTISPVMDKVASVSSTRRRQNPSVNAFDELVKGAEAPVSNWLHPTREIEQLRTQFMESITELEVRQGSVDQAAKIAMMELTQQAYQTYRDGSSVPRILHACVSTVDSEAMPDTVQKLATDLTFELGNMGCVLDNEKLASYGEVNRNHPLPQKFSKVATLRQERVHLEYALDDLRRDLHRVNEELRGLVG